MPARDPVPPDSARLPEASRPADGATLRLIGPGPATADEAMAAEARRRLREQGIIPIEADCRVGVMLDRDELLVAIRRSVAIERRKPQPVEPAGLGGDLYVTTRRLLHLGRRSIAWNLDEIREAVVAGDQLLLVLEDGMGLAISVDDPRLLRVEIAAARAAARVEARAAADAERAIEDRDP